MNELSEAPDRVTIHNLRDYGGYSTRNGGRLKKSELYRSGQLSEAGTNELARLDQLSLQSIVDLRGDRERAEHPFQVPPGASYRVIHAHGGQEDAPHLSSRFAGLETVSDVRAVMATFYAQMPFLPECLDAFSVYLKSLAEAPGPSLVHCFAGKDRTGFAVALLHKLVGVDDDDLLADYLQTNATGQLRVEAGIEVMRRKHGQTINETALREVMMVRPEYLIAAFNSISSTAGSVDNYIRNHLGVSDLMAEQIRTRLIG